MLLVTLSIITVAAICIGSYLMLVQNQTSAVSRSQTWNAVIPVSEAGLEEGLALVNLGAPNIIISPWAWTNSVTSNGWSGFSGTQTSLTRYITGSNYYTVTVDISSGTPVITSVGFIPLNSVPWIFSGRPGPFLAQVGGNQGGSTTVNLARKVQIQTVLNPLFSAAIITKLNFDMNGNGTTVDSFDSSNPLYSTLGQYNASLRKSGGDVATDSSIVGDVSLGNGNIYGHVYTGPGTQQSAVQVGPNGAVGTAAWQSGNSGIEAGYWSGDFNVNIPDVAAPPTGTTTLPAPVNGVVTLSGGNYTISTSDPNIGKPLVVSGSATLWVQGSYSPNSVTISNNAKLSLYVGTTSGSGDSLSLGGNGAMNSPGYAANLQFYGLPSVTAVTFSGNAGFIGTIYAPEAAMTGNGGGNNTLDTVGSMIVNSVTLHGHWNFHYDESLKTSGPSLGWIARNWTELKYP